MQPALGAGGWGPWVCHPIFWPGLDDFVAPAGPPDQLAAVGEGFPEGAVAGCAFDGLHERRG